MFYKIKFFSFVLILFSLFSPVLASAKSEGVLYYGEGCMHCAKVEAFMEEQGLDDGIVKKEIYRNPQNASEFNEVCDENGIKLMNRGVPFLSVGDKCYIGDEQIINYFNNVNNVSNKNSDKNKKSNLTIPLVVGAALVDAINPCAFAVLLILMMTVLATGKKKKALFSGLSFSLSIFLSYFLMGLGLYSVVVNFHTAKLFIKIIGVIAILLGVLNLKDFFWYGKLFLMEVPLSWRPKLKKLITGITNPLGAFLIGFIVSLFLLPCTSGPYIVIIGMLGNQVTHSSAIRLLVLYNLVFVLPMIAISFGTYFGLDIKKAENERVKSLKWLHLIAGIIMLLMGVYLIMVF